VGKAEFGIADIFAVQSPCPGIHSITSSARPSTDGGIVRPSAPAARRRWRAPVERMVRIGWVTIDADVIAQLKLPLRGLKMSLALADISICRI